MRERAAERSSVVRSAVRRTFLAECVAIAAQSMAVTVLLCIAVLREQYRWPLPVFCIIRIKIVLKLIVYYVLINPVYFPVGGEHLGT